MTDDRKARRRVLHEILADTHDAAPLLIAHELVDLMQGTICDEGKPCDTGAGFGGADIWAWIGGREYFINIRPSKGQLMREGKVDVE